MNTDIGIAVRIALSMDMWEPGMNTRTSAVWEAEKSVGYRATRGDAILDALRLYTTTTGERPVYYKEIIWFAHIHYPSYGNRVVCRALPDSPFDPNVTRIISRADEALRNAVTACEKFDDDARDAHVKEHDREVWEYLAGGLRYYDYSDSDKLHQGRCAESSSLGSLSS